MVIRDDPLEDTHDASPSPFAGPLAESVAVDPPPQDQSAETMSPERFAPLCGMPGIAAIARDEHWRVLWCNEFAATLTDRTPREALGTTLNDIMPDELARERIEHMGKALRLRSSTTYYQLLRGSRWFTRVWPLDPSSFGVRGVFIIMQSIAQDSKFHLPESRDTVVLRTGQFDDLDILSQRELEVFYHVARGLTSAEIAGLLYRSARTIEQHTVQIYRKLGISSRAQLARTAVERGIIAFTPEQWQTIVDSRVSADQPA